MVTKATVELWLLSSEGIIITNYFQGIDVNPCYLVANVLIITNCYIYYYGFVPFAPMCNNVFNVKRGGKAIPVTGREDP
jgi:hypothetical protein